ncbi:hypothetical protein [Bacillus suaedae]|uniref:Uncharacterized protein n=1 Tax=Halalkalibacter suaedae TaxID=2822140 RepID=A0A940X1L3_9BACI|nr:hypothetical protein [Bacillus suaedae]MBP3953199.1 hypothetical protein [Bacillus suaedae]
MEHYYDYEQEINRLKQQIHYLNQHINKLNEYINHLNIYEYYIQEMKIETVKGMLQLGHLIEKEIKDSQGIHRFYIGNIKINEIEDSGTVSVGITEKETDTESPKVIPEEASEEIKELFEEIKSHLAIEEVPVFFQKLAVEPKVLKEVWDKSKNKLQTTQIQSFYEEILQILSQLPDGEQDLDLSNLTIEEAVCEAAVTRIETYSKTLIMMILLLQSLLPGYLKKDLQKNMMKQKKIYAHVQQPNGQVDSIQLMRNIKKTFELRELPTSYKDLAENSEAVTYLYNRLVVIVSSEGEDMFKKMKSHFLETVESMEQDIELVELDSEQMGFLYGHLLTMVEEYSKYVVLDYLVVPMCK